MTVYINGTTGYSGPVGTIGDLTTTGNTTLGDASGDTLTLNGNTASIPNGLNFTNGNLGLGATPSAWSSSWKALQTNNGYIGNATSNNIAIGGNNYVDSGGAYRYITSAAANQYQLASDGSHFWRIAGSGTAGNAITWTQAMTLDANGNLGIGTTSPSARLHATNSVVGTTYPLVLSNPSATNNGRGVGMTLAGGSGNIGEILGYYDGTDQALYLTSTNGSMRFNAAGAERMRITSGGTVIVGTGTTSSTDTMLLYPASGDSLLNLKGSGAYIGLNSVVGGYSHVQGLDNGTLRWRLGQSAYGGADGCSIYYGSSATEATRFASTVEMYRPMLLRNGLADTYSGALSGTYTSGTWYELASSGNLGSGIFVLQLYVDTFLTGSVYYMIYASVPFFIYHVGSNNTVTFTLPTMYGTGHASNGVAAPPIRLRMTGGGAGIFVDIQPNENWSGLNSTGGRNVNFAFKRIG